MSNYKLDIYQGMADCDKCPLNGAPQVMSNVSSEDGVDILWVAQSPGRVEVERGEPLVGQSGTLIHSVSDQYTAKWAKVNCLSCRPIDAEGIHDRAPVTAEVKSCRQRLHADMFHVLSTYNPKVVVVLGAVAKKEVNAIMKVNPDLITIPIHFIDHPAFILHNRQNKQLEERYKTNLHNILKSTFTNPDASIEDKFLTYKDGLKFQFIDDYTHSAIAGVDIETNGLDMFNKGFKIGTCAVSCDKYTYFFDFRDSNFFDCQVFIDFLRYEPIQKVFADVLFDVVSIQEKGNVVVENIADVFPLAFGCDNTHYNYNLEALVMRYCPQFASYKQEFKSGLTETGYLGADTEKLKLYNSYDSFLTKWLYTHLYEKLDPRTKNAFDKITVRLLPVLVNIKISGMKTDRGLLNEYTKTFNARLAYISEIFATKHGVTNINSTPQVRKWLFEDLKIVPIKWTDKTKKTPSTDKVILPYYVKWAPDAMLLYEARRLASLLNYTLPSILEALDDNDLIHPRYKHFGIQSLRISCQAPNMQGLSRDKSGMAIFDDNPIRRLFIAKHPDSWIMEFDYSQQEVRIMACLSGDPNMIKAFNEGLDIHKYVASIVFCKLIEKVTDFERQVAKGCVFGAIFGVSAPALAIDLRITERQAQAYIDTFYKTFPKVKKFTEKWAYFAIKNKYVISPTGRVRRFIIDRYNVNEVKREGPNHVIQCTGAEFIFLSLIRVHKELKDKGLLNKGVDIIHTVHDSLMTDAITEHLVYLEESVSRVMCQVPIDLGFKAVPFTVEASIGKRWGEKVWDSKTGKSIEDVIDV